MIEHETFVPLMKRSAGFEELKRQVVDAGLCSLCGGCAALCTRIKMTPDGPEGPVDCVLELDAPAIKCGEDGTCFDACPMIDFPIDEMETTVFGHPREDQDLGVYRRVIAARSAKPEIRDRAQDGGTVTSILMAAFEKGLADGALETFRSEDWHANPSIIPEAEHIVRGAGTVYTRAPVSSKLGESFRSGIRNLILVGTGCQTTAARKVEQKFLKKISQISLTTIGLFCFENFSHTELERAFSERFQISMKDIARMDIKKGQFKVIDSSGKEFVAPVKEFNNIVPPACKKCTNFTAELADISVGAVGTPEGWNTVLIRSEKGEQLFNTAKELGYLEVRDEVNLDEVRRNVNLKTKKGKKQAKTRPEA